MAFDFKKEYKKLYLPKDTPEIIKVPPISYVAVQGQGDPNEEGGAYQQAVQTVYAVSYTIRMSYKSDRLIPGFYPYIVPPLEGFWWQEGTEGVNYGNKSGFHWLTVLRLPDFVQETDCQWAAQVASNKKKIDCTAARFLTIDEGLCVQMMHVGSYDQEPRTVARMDAYLFEQGYENDLSPRRRHHEIYLSDPRKVERDRQRTVIRHPIRMREG